MKEFLLFIWMLYIFMKYEQNFMWQAGIYDDTVEREFRRGCYVIMGITTAVVMGV